MPPSTKYLLDQEPAGNVATSAEGLGADFAEFAESGMPVSKNLQLAILPIKVKGRRPYTTPWREFR